MFAFHLKVFWEIETKFLVFLECCVYCLAVSVCHMLWSVGPGGNTIQVGTMLRCGETATRQRDRERVRERVEEILKRLPTRYNEPLSSVLHDTCSQIFCLIRAKLKYSNRLVLMLPPNTQEAYCTFLVFDLSVCCCLSISSFVKKTQLDTG